MNRKEGIIVSALLITTFFGSALAAPTVQNIFITNDPLNIRIVGGTLTPQTTSVDIEVLDIVPGVTQSNTQFGGPTGTTGIWVLNTGPGSTSINFTAGFSFAPRQGFVQVNRVVATVVYSPGTTFNTSPPDSLGVSLNGNPATSITMNVGGTSIPSAVVGDLQTQYLSSGSNIMNIGLIKSGPNNVQAFLYEVRLTVEYTFMA